MLMQILFLVFFLFNQTASKIHYMTFENDKRLFIHLLDFGFLSESFLQVSISNFSTQFDKFSSMQKIGFTLNRGDEVNELLKAPSDCVLRRPEIIADVVYLPMDFSKREISIDRVGEKDSFKQLKLCSPIRRNMSDSRNCYKNNEPNLLESKTRNFSAEIDQLAQETHLEPLDRIPLEISDYGFTAQFEIDFEHRFDEGQYSLIFHNCKNYGADLSDQIGISYTIKIVAKNKDTFLSAGESINPPMYFGLSILFFATWLFWVLVLKTTKDTVYKIHYLMAALVLLKCLSLLFHGINYYFISVYGQQKAVWAVVYYLMHLLKGLLLFGVIMLIGTGWTFFKNFLTDRDRRLFMIVIPLQILDNMALIIKEESEIGQKSYSFWLKMFILIDLICCAAIILPVIWSIRHLQEASRTDGKAAFNLKKLKLFRHFYIIVICYVYLTRIVNYLVIFTVPFKHAYVAVLVVEISSWFFYVLTGNMFRPAANNPYLKLAIAEEDDDDEMEDVLLQSGALENVVRVNRSFNIKKSTATQRNREEIEMEQAFINAELSHELD